MNNKSVSDIWRHSRLSICQSFFPEWIYNMIQIHSGKTSSPLWRSVAVRLHWSSLRARSEELMRGWLLASLDSRIKRSRDKKHWRWIHRHFVTKKVNRHQAFSTSWSARKGLYFVHFESACPVFRELLHADF